MEAGLSKIFSGKSVAAKFYDSLLIASEKDNGGLNAFRPYLEVNH